MKPPIKQFPDWPDAKVDPQSYTVLQRTAFERGEIVGDANLSAVMRARDVLRRVCLDPSNPTWDRLVREIARAIGEAYWGDFK